MRDAQPLIYCQCARPMAFDETCTKCGRRVRGNVTTERLEIELAKIALEHTKRQRTGGDQPRRK